MYVVASDILNPTGLHPLPLRSSGCLGFSSDLSFGSFGCVKNWFGGIKG